MKFCVKAAEKENRDVKYHTLVFCVCHGKHKIMYTPGLRVRELCFVKLCCKSYGLYGGNFVRNSKIIKLLSLYYSCLIECMTTSSTNFIVL